MNQTLFKARQQLSSWLLPVHCVACQRRGQLLCAKCRRLIHFNQNTDNSLFQQQYLDQVLILAVYQPPISNLIQQLKYHRVQAISQILAELLYQHLIITPHDYLTWAPTSVQRVSNRGFNQAQLIAEHLAVKLNTPSRSILTKTRHTPKQAGSSFQQRVQNLKNSFAIKPHYKLAVQGQRILILDDVISTGSTLDECARVLKQAKVQQVTGLAVAQS